jgi:hypothetical protein
MHRQRRKLSVAPQHVGDISAAIQGIEAPASADDIHAVIAVSHFNFFRDVMVMVIALARITVYIPFAVVTFCTGAHA